MFSLRLVLQRTEVNPSPYWPEDVFNFDRCLDLDSPGLKCPPKPLLARGGVYLETGCLDLDTPSLACCPKPCLARVVVQPGVWIPLGYECQPSPSLPEEASNLETRCHKSYLFVEAVITNLRSEHAIHYVFL